MRSPLSSRTNSRPERVTPDEFFDLVASSTVMVFPSCRSCLVSTCPRWPLFDAREPPTRVKHREPRRITGNEKAAHVGRIRQDRWTWHFSAIRVRFLQSGEGPAHGVLCPTRPEK